MTRVKFGVSSEVADFNDYAIADDKDIAKPKTYVCVICEPFLDEVLENVIRDEELFPPPCCTHPLSVDQAEHFLSTKLAENFDEEAIEF